MAHRKATLTTLVAVLLSICVGLLVGIARVMYECVMVVPLVPDPQSGIWVMLSCITTIIVAVTIAAACFVALRGFSAESFPVKCLMCVPLLLLIAWYSAGFFNLAEMRAALLDAADPTTGADRLRELASYSGGPGYEIDNRIAKHPNTPSDVLRSLHGRPDQVGTEMLLAENPQTPDDIQLELAERDDEWADYIQEGPRRNPRYAEVFPGDDLFDND